MKHVEQISVSFLINIITLGTGASYGIANVLLSTNKEVKYLSYNTSNIIQRNLSEYDGLLKEFTINSDQASWIASFNMIGQYFPIFFVGPVISKYGKRKSLMIDSMLLTLGFVLMTFAFDVYMLYMAKFFFGYAYLSSRSSIQPFIGEISDTNIRGITSSLQSLLFTSGQAFSMLSVGYMRWRYASGIFVVLMSVCLIGVISILETAEWLLEAKQFNKAIMSLEFYKNDKKSLVTDENKRRTKDGEERSYKDLVKLYRIESKIKSKAITTIGDNSADKSSWMDIMKLKMTWIKETVVRPEIYKPFRILIVLFGLLELSGFAVLANYSIIMVEHYGYGSKTFVTPETMMTFITLSRIPMSFLAMPVLTKFKKRPLYLSVCFFLLLVISGIIAFTHVVETGALKKTTFQESIALQCVPFLLFTLFYAGSSFGYGNIPSILMGELFPSYIANVASTTILVLVNTIELTAVKTALMIKEKYGLQYTFVIPAVAILLSAIYAAIFMPETHGLTRKEIGEKFAPKEEGTLKLGQSA